MNKKPLTFRNSGLSTYNLAVKQAYYAILKITQQLLSHIEQEELRYTLVRDERNLTEDGVILHEFVNPLLYLRLECRDDKLFAIHYGFEQVNQQLEYSNITALFTRYVYSLTSKQTTGSDIESCVKTDWCINTPSAMYEYIEERQKHHAFKLIKHKVTAGQRKRLLSVA
jgi:hypothetical protein